MGQEGSKNLSYKKPDKENIGAKEAITYSKTQHFTKLYFALISNIQ